MPINLKHAVASQRRHYRVTVPISISIDGIEYVTVDWSISGFRIKGWEREWKADDIRNIYLRIPFHGFDIGFLAKARLVRIDADAAQAAGEFVELDTRRQETLAMFVQGLTRGEMAAIGGVIKRLDVPVTPPSLHQAAQAALPAHEAELKRRRGMRLYTVAGASLAIVLAVVLYTNFFQLRVDTAMVSGHDDVLVAPGAGEVTYMAEFDKPVAAGTPLLTVTDQKLQEDIQAAQFRLRDAAVEAGRLNAVLKVEKNRLSAAHGIVAHESSAAINTVHSLEKSLKARQAIVARMKPLLAQGYLSQIAYDRAQSDVYDAENQLNVAREESARREEESATVQQGFQVNGEAVQNGVQDIEQMRQAAEGRLANAQADLAALKERELRMTLKAPAAGRLVRVFTPQNSAARFGEPVAVFEQNGTHVVQAFLTQQEALHVAKGDEAKVYFASHWGSVPARVIDVDRYSLTLGQERGMYQWQNYQNDEFKTVLVTLEAAGGDAQQRVAKIAPGTASKVVFDLM